MSASVQAAANTGLRARVRALVEHPWFVRGIMALIIVNAVTLGLETSKSVMASAGDLLLTVDKAILAIFVVEILLRVYAHGLRFFRDPWSWFDMIIVGIALVPASEGFSVLRALRVLRVLRLVSTVPRLRRVVGALLHAVPGIGAVGALLMLVFYVFAVMATKLFGAGFEDWFGTVGNSMYSLFQIMTLESWSMGIVRPVMEVYPQAWAFFVIFIMISSFTVLNLFIAIIVDSMQTLHDAEQEETISEVSEVIEADAKYVSAEIKELRSEIRELKELLAKRDQ